MWPATRPPESSEPAAQARVVPSSLACAAGSAQWHRLALRGSLLSFMWKFALDRPFPDCIHLYTALNDTFTYEIAIMYHYPLPPRTILHLDADAFFASV